MRKVIVIGLDGLDPSIAEELLQRGELPHFARVRDSGFCSRLATTCPAQTPVAWSSFATGANPGSHGIFDFIRRNPDTYLPDFALTSFERPKSIFGRPRAVNQRKGIPLWQLLGEAGIPSIVLRCPCTFPPDAVQGRMLAGVGVPDMRGSQGKPTFYTQDKAIGARDDEIVVHLDAGDNLVTHVVGPRDTRSRPSRDIHSSIQVQVDRPGRRLTIQAAGLHHPVAVVEGAWSEWVPLRFPLSALQSVSGIVRLFLCRLLPHLEFYCSPVNFDPASPMFPISSPAGYARQLSEQMGLYSTLGMAEDHTGLNNGRFDEAAYLDQCALVFAEREKMTLFELGQFREGLFFVVFDTPDRIQHMFWRFGDDQHPCYQAAGATEFGGCIHEHYRRCDQLLGRVLEYVDEDTLLVVLSDHGFSSFRRAVHVNYWLWQKGLLAFRGDKLPEGNGSGAVAEVDWSRTQAYAVGFVGIYLNLRGRERQGLLEEGSQAEGVRQAIQSGLGALTDPLGQARAIHGVSRREEIYAGPYVAEAPDLLVKYAPGYRASWQTALGGVSDRLFEDNKRRWSGDHIIDPEAVPGVLFMNRAGSAERPDIRDLAPTILRCLGVPPSPCMEGKCLL